jgi:hypothetical protein
LIALAGEQGWAYGVQPSDLPETTHVIYFDVPGVGQLSWHYTPHEPLSVYAGEWDRQENATLKKLEAAIVVAVGDQCAAR